MEPIIGRIRSMLNRGEKDSAPSLEQRGEVANATIASFGDEILGWKTKGMYESIRRTLYAIDPPSGLTVRLLVARAINDMKDPDGKIFLKSYEGGDGFVFATAYSYDSTEHDVVPEGKTALVVQINLDEFSLKQPNADSHEATVYRYYDLIGALTALGRTLQQTEDSSELLSRKDVPKGTKFPVGQYE